MSKAITQDNEAVIVIQFDQPIIRAERRMPGQNEIIHCREARIDQLTAAYAERRRKQSVTRYTGIVAILSIMVVLLTGALFALTE